MMTANYLRSGCLLAGGCTIEGAFCIRHGQSTPRLACPGGLVQASIFLLSYLSNCLSTYRMVPDSGSTQDLRNLDPSIIPESGLDRQLLTDVFQCTTD